MGCPRDNRTYQVQQVLSCDQTTAKADVLTRYGKFFKGLRASTSKEVATMANLVSRDIQTTTGKNLRLIETSSGLSAWDAGQDKLKEAVRMKEAVSVDEAERWRIHYLCKLLAQKQELSYLGEEVEEISSLINSLGIN